MCCAAKMMSIYLRSVCSVVYLIIYCFVGSHLEILIEESPSMEAVQAPMGGVVELRCDVTPALHGDSLSLVIWYKQGHHDPIYSFDIREGVTSHWSDPMTLGSRASFRSDSTPAVLILTKLRAEDSGQYRCRVDFIKSPTKNTRLNLTILVPPDRLMIENHDGNEVLDGILGPYDEGSEINITCIAVGGRPPARVSWWKSHALLANSEARATVAFTLQRSDCGAEVTCQAVTHPSIPPISATLKIDMILPLLWLQLVGGKRPLVAGQAVELVCQAVGARPKANITWWKGGTRLKPLRETVSTDGNTTSSTLRWVPSLTDAGRVLSCRSQHHEDGWTIEVQHVPLITLELGANLDANKVVEGSDVYLDCRVKANPWHTLVYFTHNGILVKPGPGVVLANQSLVLQRVLRKAAGDYVCVARNSLGEGLSDKLKLDVKYTPTCKSNHTTVIRAAIGEVVDIDCDVDANPKEPMSYQWWFNSSTHSKNELPTTVKSIHNNTLHRYEFAIQSPGNYGWLQCKADNSLHGHHVPCVFNILPADKPSPVKHCEITNVTNDSLTVMCTPGYDGGIGQNFLLQIIDTVAGTLLSNITASVAEFQVSGLTTTNSLAVTITAYNKHGSSTPHTLTAHLLSYPERQTARLGVHVELQSVLGIIVASVLGMAALVTLFTAIYCYASYRKRHTDKTEKEVNAKEPTSNTPLTTKKENCSADDMSNKTAAEYREISDRNPDIISSYIDDKTKESSSSKSSTTDYCSIRPLIPNRSNEKDNISHNYEIYCDHKLECNQYAYGQPMEYSIRPSCQPMPNHGPYIQKVGPMINFGPTNASFNDHHQNHDKDYEDWLKYQNAASLNTGVMLPPKQLMPAELYPPSISPYINPRTVDFHQISDREQIYHLEPRSLVDSRSFTSSSPVRFQDSNVYYSKNLMEKGHLQPNSES